jgi:hypothetical protein
MSGSLLLLRRLAHPLLSLHAHRHSEHRSCRSHQHHCDGSSEPLGSLRLWVRLVLLLFLLSDLRRLTDFRPCSVISSIGWALQTAGSLIFYRSVSVLSSLPSLLFFLDGQSDARSRRLPSDLGSQERARPHARQGQRRGRDSGLVGVHRRGEEDVEERVSSSLGSHAFAWKLVTISR